MAVETSLGKLQKQVAKLEKENIKLKDLLEERKEKQKLAEINLKYYKENIEKIINEAVKKATTEMIKELNKVKEENEHLKRILNHNSSNTGIPTSKTKIGEEKRIPNSREKSNKPKGGQIGHKKSKLERFKDNEITDTYTYEIAKPICKEMWRKTKFNRKKMQR